MTPPQAASPETILRLVQDALRRGARVDIDGLGSFIPGNEGGFEFVPNAHPTVFITYVHEDAAYAEALYDSLTVAGFDPWMDRRKLLPGQNWPRAIEDAMSVSDFVVALFSTRSVNKKGGFQAEIRYALDCAQRIPLDQVYLVPVRLDECRVPERIVREVQYVNMFPHWEAGIAKVVGMLRRQTKARRPEREALLQPL